MQLYGWVVVETKTKKNKKKTTIDGQELLRLRIIFRVSVTWGFANTSKTIKKAYTEYY